MSDLAGIVGEHDLAGFRAFGVFFEGWATVDGGALADGLERMRRGVEDLREQNALIFDGLVKMPLLKPKPVQATSTARSASRRSVVDIRTDWPSHVRSGSAQVAGRNAA
jgi:hypothetical protein